MNEFDLILEECVDLVASGESSLEECLSSYPEYAAQLEPILNSIVCLQEEGRDVVPSSSLRSRIRGELNHVMKNDPPKKSRSLFFFAPGIEHVLAGSESCDDQYGFCPGGAARGEAVQLETGKWETLTDKGHGSSWDGSENFRSPATP
jgi:hypothetical protein